MSRVALIRDGIVANVIEAGLEFAASLPGYDAVMEAGAAGPGWLLVAGELAPPTAESEPDAPVSMTKLSFIRRFTLSERIHMTSSDDPIIQDCLLMLQVAEDISLSDADTVAFVNYVRDNGYITSARAEEILSLS